MDFRAFSALANPTDTGVSTSSQLGLGSELATSSRVEVTFTRVVYLARVQATSATLSSEMGLKLRVCLRWVLGVDHLVFQSISAGSGDKVSYANAQEGHFPACYVLSAGPGDIGNLEFWDEPLKLRSAWRKR